MFKERHASPRLKALFGAFPVVVGGGAEVDLVLEIDNCLCPIEIKLTANPGKHQASGIAAFRAAHPGRAVAPGLLVCAVEQARWLSEDTLAMPWGLLGQ